MYIIYIQIRCQDAVIPGLWPDFLFLRALTKSEKSAHEQLNSAIAINV